jgi:predicted RNA methylase
VAPPSCARQFFQFVHLGLHWSAVLAVTSSKSRHLEVVINDLEVGAGCGKFALIADAAGKITVRAMRITRLASVVMTLAYCSR